MSEYKLEIKQIVDYPRCRIYRQFIQCLIKDPNIRSGGSSGLFYYTVLCGLANFRTSYKRIDGISYTVYYNIRKEQLKRLMYDTKPDVFEKLLFHLQNNRRIYHDKNTDILYADADTTLNMDTIKCLWVLCDFVEKADFHSSSDFPVNLIFFGDEELYEISYIAQGKEAIFEQAFKNFEVSNKRVIVLEEKEQISKINIPDVTAYCIVNDDTGEVKYFKSQEGG